MTECLKNENFKIGLILADFRRKEKGGLFFDKGASHLVHVVLSGLARESHHPIFDREGIAYLAKDKTFFFGGRLDGDITKIEHSRNHAINSGSDILDARETEFANTSGKESFLFDIDDALVGNNPDIKVIINPNQKTKEPQEQEKGALHKSKKSSTVRPYLWKERGEYGNAPKKKQREQNDGTEVHQDIEPVAMNHHEYLLVLMLALKVEATKSVLLIHML